MSIAGIWRNYWTSLKTLPIHLDIVRKDLLSDVVHRTRLLNKYNVWLIFSIYTIGFNNKLRHYNKFSLMIVLMFMKVVFWLIRSNHLDKILFSTIFYHNTLNFRGNFTTESEYLHWLKINYCTSAILFYTRYTIKLYGTLSLSVIKMNAFFIWNLNMYVLEFAKAFPKTSWYKYY